MTIDRGPGVGSRRINSWLLVLVAAIATGCGGAKEPKAASDSSGAPIGESPGPIARGTSPETKGTATACPRTGLWAACSVERRLEQAGFVVRKAAAPPRRPGFSIAPVGYTLGRGKLEVFVYPDAKALQRDWSELDTLSASPRGKPSQFDVPPTLVRSANLAAIYLTDSPIQAERLSLALTAGPPQPGSTLTVKQRLPSVDIRPQN